jgi:hypothetical protein
MGRGGGCVVDTPVHYHETRQKLHLFLHMRWVVPIVNVVHGGIESTNGHAHDLAERDTHIELIDVNRIKEPNLTVHLARRSISTVCRDRF